MKLALAIAGLAVLAACADVPTDRHYPGPGLGWGQQQGPRSWGYERGQAAPALISEIEAQQLTDEVTQLKAQRGALASNLPRVTDPARRREQMRAIDDINGRLEMLEYRLRAAGRPVPR